MKKFFIIIIFLFLLLSKAAFAGDAQTYIVERVINGGMLKLTNGEKVRLIGVDALESHVNIKAKRDSRKTGRGLKTITRTGREATKFIRGLIEGKEVMLDFDVKRKDENGYLLAYVYLLQCRDCTMDGLLEYEYELFDNKDTGREDYYLFLNATIIKIGYATPLAISLNVRYAASFKELYRSAKDNGRGLWRRNRTSLNAISYCKSHDDCKIIRDLCRCTDICISKDAEVGDCSIAENNCVFSGDTPSCYCRNNECVWGS